MSPQDRNSELLLKWLNRELSEEELAELQQSPDFEAYSKIVSTADSWDKPIWNESEAFEELLEKKDKKKGKVIFSKPMWYGLAASIFIALFLVIKTQSASEQIISIATNYGEEKTINLPDASLVKLNGLSNIDLDTVNWALNRYISLEGEAYFEVEKGGAFQVDFKPGQLFVRGTKFNIRSREGNYQVECYEGRVAVYQGQDSLVLTQGQSAQFNGADIEEGTFTHDRPYWLGGKSKFNAAKLSVVFAALEAEYGVKVIVQDIDKERKFTGEFTHDDLDKALQMICIPMNFHFKIEGKKVVVSEKR